MTTLTLTAAAATRDLAGLVPDGARGDEESLLDRYARALWSTLTEPGDGVAGRLIEMLGPVLALEVALGSDAALGGCRDTPDLGDLRRARRRWQPRLGEGDHALAVARHARVTLVTPLDEAWPSRLGESRPCSS